MKQAINGMAVTQGPGGKAVNLGKKLKNVQVLRSMVLQLLSEMTTEPDYIDGERVLVVYHKHLLEKLEDMGERNPQSKVNQLITHHYLVYRTQAPDPVSFFIFASKNKGEKFAQKRPKNKN
jgi:hypothetical protein